jgi:hypothetical protein
MVRSSLTFVAGLLAVASAAGNGLPPPPVGKKFVPVEHVITTPKAFPEYDFYLMTGGALNKVAFDPDAPVKIAANRPRGFKSQLLFAAVPTGAAAKYADGAAFAEALVKGKVSGQAVAKERFEVQTAVDAKDESRTATVTHVVERIDAKEGIVFRGAPAEKAAPPGKAAPDPPGPRGGGVVAGLAVALAMGFAGLRLARRRPA